MKPGFYKAAKSGAAARECNDDYGNDLITYKLFICYTINKIILFQKLL